MVAQPYRDGELRGGVALPRRGLRLWTAAIVVLAQTLGGLFVFVGLRPVFLLISGWMVAVAALAIRMLHRPRPRPGFMLMLSVMPVLLVELWTPVLGANPAANARMLDSVASMQLLIHGASAIACAVVAVSGAGVLLSIDWRRRSEGQEKPSSTVLGWGLLCATLFVVTRVHGTHRDSLGGALAAIPIIASGLFGTFAPIGLARLDDWHDEEEATDVRSCALVGMLAILLCGITIERAVLANDEHHALHLLANAHLGFEERLEAAHALASAWCSHGNMIAMLAGAMLVPMLRIVRGLRRPGLDTMIGLPLVGMAIAAIIVLTLARQPTFVPVTPATHHDLPQAPTLAPMREPIGSLRITLDADGNTPPEAKTWAGPCTFVVNRTMRSATVLRVASELKGCRSTWLLVEGATATALTNVEFANQLAGPRISVLPLDVGTPSDDVVWVIDDVESGRVRLTNALVRGIIFRRTFDARELRKKLAQEITRIPRDVVLAPHEGNNVQELVDAIAALREVFPGAVVRLTTDVDGVDRIFRSL